MSTDPMQIIFDLLRKGKNSWSKDDKEKYDLAFLLLSPEEEAEFKKWERETPDLYLRRRND
tara:strand:- start:201 stop:383 length:183 start_codon:yes stop_codon:yes gene_type:complete